MKPDSVARSVVGRLWHWICRTVRTLRGRLPGRPYEYFRHRRGRTAEEAVARYLRKKGYRILERNFRCTGGELDLIVFQDGVIAFVEVRSVTEPAGLDPLLTVTTAKQRHLLRAAQHYITLRELHGENVVLRFDVVAVRRTSAGRINDITHIENAFGA
jgi:putative endonuclease